MGKYDNEVIIEMQSKSQNEGFARMAVAGFVSVLDPTISDIADIKMAVSEAITNSIIHGYKNDEGKIIMQMNIRGKEVIVRIKDWGKGIENVDEARMPLFTTTPDEDERAGMGFTVMESFMDRVEVTSQLGVGTEIVMSRKLA